MKTTVRHIHHHVIRHIKRHHKKYLFGLFGGFAVAKLVVLVVGLSVVEYTTTSTFAQSVSGCQLTGQYYTGEYVTGGYLTGQELVGGTLVDCVTIPGYWTGGTLDESGVLVGQIRIEAIETGCVLSGQTLSEGYWTGGILTGGYWTGGTLVCDEDPGTGDVVPGTGTVTTGTVTTGTITTGTIITGTNQQQIIVSGSANGICESQDIVFSPSISGSVVRNSISFSWTYLGTDCSSGLSLQLRDHNNQRITLAVIPSGATSYVFDSRRLYSFQHSGLYTMMGNTGAGNFVLYSGAYSGNYSRFFTGYKLRFLGLDQTSFQETLAFTIDNNVPTLSGVTLLADGLTSGYVARNDILTLRFTSSEILSGLSLTLGSGMVPTSSSISGLVYTYVRNLASFSTEGTLNLSISFADIAGNTGTFSADGLFVFDTTPPNVSRVVFEGYSGGVYLTFSGSEPINYTSSYQGSGSTLFTGATPAYLSAHILNFPSISPHQLYTFTVHVFDRAGNSRLLTGDFLKTSTGNILSHIFIVPVSGAVATTGNLSSLAVILRAEVGKFNTCKDALHYAPVELDIRNNKFLLRMPMFTKSQMKTLVNAFTLFILSQIKNNTEMNSGDIAQITKKFDNFLIILKLIRDDDNTCKQNLSNYHISQFKNALEEFGLD